MNQREATVLLIEFARAQMTDDPQLLRALKVLEKRAELLRVRNERLRACLPADLQDEPLTVTWEQFRGIFRSHVCVACYSFKEPSVAFCYRCWQLVDGSTAKAFKDARTIHAGFCRALRLFGRIPVTEPDGELRWEGPISPRGSRPIPKSPHH